MKDPRDIRDALLYVVYILLFIAIIFLVIYSVDRLHSESTPGKFIEKKCIDKNGGEFKDEYCIYEFHCSWLGLTEGGYRCFSERWRNLKSR